MNVPREFWRVKVKSIQDPTVRTAAVRYMQRVQDMIIRGAGLLLCGAPGVGKTAVAIVVAKEIRSYGFSVFFVSVWELKESVKGRIDFDEEHTFMDKARDSDVLILDNVKPDESKDPYFNLKVLEELITFRCSQSRPTFLTTRVRANQLEKQLPGIMEAAKGKILELAVKGKDLRQQLHDDLASDLLGSDDGS